MNEDFAPTPAASLLPNLSDSDRGNLQAAVAELFHHQAILRDLPGDRDLYDWARLRFSWVREICQLAGFEAVLNEDDQMILALPGGRASLRKLRTEWTLVLLGLWYDYDVKLREDGAPVVFSIEEFNDSLKTKLGERQPPATALREILRFFATRKLVRMDYEDDFHRSRIEVLPTIRFVLPFGELEKVSEVLENLMDGGSAGREEDEDG